MLLTAVISFAPPAASARAMMLPSLTYIFFAWEGRVSSLPQLVTVTCPEPPAEPLAEVVGWVGEEQALRAMRGRVSQATARARRVIMWSP